METKKQFKWFTIFEYEKEQDYLQDMHKSGWKFVRVTGLGMYHFEKYTPQDMVYHLDYNKEGRAHKDEYLKMFDDCGWEYIQDHAEYSYFRKAASEGDESGKIFCDEESRRQMMEQVLKGRMSPSLIIFFAVLLPNFIMNLFTFHNYLVAILLGSILVIYPIIFAMYFVKYRQYTTIQRNSEASKGENLRP